MILYLHIKKTMKISSIKKETSRKKDEIDKYTRFINRLVEENKENIKKEKSLSSDIHEIKNKIDVIESKRKIDGIRDIYDLKFFSQKFIKSMVIDRVDKNILPKVDKYYTHGLDRVYFINMESNTGTEITILYG